MTHCLRFCAAALLLLGLTTAHPGLAQEECTYHVSSLAVTGGDTDGTQLKPWSLYDAGEETTPSGEVDAGDVVCIHADGVYSDYIHTRGGGNASEGRIVFRNVPGMPLPQLTPDSVVSGGGWGPVCEPHPRRLDSGFGDPLHGLRPESPRPHPWPSSGR